MRFEVVRDGRTVMYSSSKACIPDAEQAQVMYRAGYRFRIDRKNVPLKTIKEMK